MAVIYSNDICWLILKITFWKHVTLPWMNLKGQFLVAGGI